MKALKALKKDDIAGANLAFGKYKYKDDDPLVLFVKGLAFLEGAGTLLNKVKAKEMFEKVESFSYKKHWMEKKPKYKDFYYKFHKNKKSQEDVLKNLKKINRELWKKEEMWKVK